MKKIFLYTLFVGLFIVLYSCNKETEILPVQEYVAIQPESFKFDPINVGSEDVIFMFKLTTFEPKSYSISKVNRDADGWVTGTVELLTVDLSGTKPNSTITGSIPKSKVFDINEVGQESMLRLTLTSIEGNTAVAEPWLMVSIK